jgi:hypothetical protein
LSAARLILNSSRPTAGFKALVAQGRSEWTIEALALRHESLFTKKQLRTARNRLTRH